MTQSAANAGRCLFSAPFHFLFEGTTSRYQSHLPTDFREIWTKDDLQPDDALTAWVPNPGQNFVIDAEVLKLFPSLQVISTPSTGTNHIDVAACNERGVSVFGLMDNRPRLDSIAASSEFTFLLLLNALRRFDVAVGEASAGRWRAREDEMRGNELEGKHVGLVGLGRNGKRMARYCNAFDATVSYHDPYVESDELESWSIERLFSDSDAVVLCFALNAETKSMIGRDLFERMKTGAVLVNTSRGEVIVENELASFVRERPDVRVALDVLAGEVTNEHHDSPLLALHREGKLIVTPHIAGATFESQNKAALGALELLENGK